MTMSLILFILILPLGVWMGTVELAQFIGDRLGWDEPVANLVAIGVFVSLMPLHRRLFKRWYLDKDPARR
jgi:hypothetical protein